MTESNTREKWQQALAADIENREDGQPHLRLSQSGHCIRKLHYIAAGEPPSDPSDPTRNNRFILGHALEVLALLALRDHGWETRLTCLDEDGQLTIETKIEGRETPVPGHPDGICRHPILTNNQWVILECKSMSEHRASQVEEIGLGKVEPSYIMQAAMYAGVLFDMEIVEHYDRGVFAIITREGRFLPPEMVRWPENLSERGHRRMSQAVFSAQENQPPERPYDEHSPNPPCNMCFYQSLCWADRTDAALQPIISGQATPLDHDPDAAEAARTWREAKQAMDAAKAVLQRKLNDNGDIPISAEGVKAEYFRRSGDENYDMREIGRYLTGDILRKNRNAKGQERILWIHPR